MKIVSGSIFSLDLLIMRLNIHGLENYLKMFLDIISKPDILKPLSVPSWKIDEIIIIDTHPNILDCRKLIKLIPISY